MPPPTPPTDDDVQALDWAVLLRILGCLRPYRRLALQLVLIMLAFAFFDASVPLLSRAAVDRFAVPRQIDGFGWFVVICVAVAVGRSLCNMGMILTGGRINSSVCYDIRRQAFGHLQELSFSYHDRHATGWLLARVTSDVESVARVLSWGIVDLVDAIGRIVIITVIMLTLHVKLACVVLAVVPVLAFIVFRFQALTLRMQRDVRRINSDVTNAFNEGIMGAQTTKTLVREDASLDEFHGLTESMFEATTRAARASALYLPFVLVTGAIGAALTLWIGGEGVMDGTVTYGTLVAFMAYAVSFFQPLQDVARRVPMLQTAQAAAERIFSMLETRPDIEDTDAAAEWALRHELDSGTGVGAPVLRGDVRFENVSFHYVPGEPVLTDLGLTVPAGETIALVGETGAGKTTIINLLSRFYEPVSGRILLDGRDYRDYPLAWLQSQFGIVQQAPQLFSGTIRDNIRYADLAADDSRIEDAAKLARAHDFIAAMPDGYDSVVGEGGSTLSVGQRQLLALARILLADPRILVLDEATSSVDTETEKRIQEAVEVAMQGRTSFLVAHRLSTIRAADRILVIGDHGILEQGTHAELLRRDGPYRRLYSTQFIAQQERNLLT